MATNCLAPAFIRLFYTSNGHNHVMTLPTINSGTGADFELLKYDNSTISLATGVNGLCDALTPLFPSTAEFTGWEAYLQTDCDSTPIFKSAGSLSGFDGSSANPSRAWGQATLTWRSAGGGRGKMMLMEGSFGVDSVEPLGPDTGPFGDLSDYLIGSGSWVYARDNTKLILPLNYTTKTNDALRRKYLT